MPFATGLSEHPDPIEATAEVAGQILDGLGQAPDAVVCFITTPHLGSATEIFATLRRSLTPGTLVGASAVSLMAGRREIEDRPAVAAWAGRIDGVRGIRLTGDSLDWIASEAGDAHSLVVIADPYSYPVDALVETAAERTPDLTVVGGMASANAGPGGQVLALDDATYHDGAVGLLLSGSTRVRTVVSQGCRPIGSPMIVTASDGNLIHELAGQPALGRLKGLLEQLPEDERTLASQGLHIGRVVDELREDFGPGDFLIRGVLGVERGSEALAVGDQIPVGATVQFQVRDAASADSDLHRLLGEFDATGDSALVFTCNGRGTHLFPESDHDATVVSDHLADAPVAGMFCAGELGPVGSRSFVHGFTASIAVFAES